MFGKNQKNKGFLEQPVQELDYNQEMGAKVGRESPIVHEVRIFDGNWSDFATDFELQKQNGLEPMDCVTQGVINSIQSQMNWMIVTNRMPQKHMELLNKYECIVDGRVQFSKKFIAILSETTKEGNYLTKVAQTVREVGVVSEKMLPISGSTWDEFYNKGQITEEMRDIGKMFFDKDNPAALFKLQYAWVLTPNSGGLKEDNRAKILHELRHTPLVIAKDGHCTLKILGINKVRWQILDSYKPFLKDRKWDYDALWVLKVVVDLNSAANNNPMKLVKTESSPHIYLISGDNKNKIMIVDMPSLEALGQSFETISKEDLDRYADGGTMIWVNRVIK